MDDDFNTPEAIAVLQGLARELNTARTANGGAQAGSCIELRALGGRAADCSARILGSSCAAPPPSSGSGRAPHGRGLSDADIDALIAARIAARKAKNWAESDRIRDELAAAGVILEDKPGGMTTWRRG